MFLWLWLQQNGTLTETLIMRFIKCYQVLPFCFPVGQQHFDGADDIELKGLLYDEKDG